MFKRLIIAVLALGFVMSLSGTAFSDVNVKPAQDAKFQSTNPSNPRFGSLSVANPLIDPATKLGDEMVREVPGGGSNTAPHAPTLGCGWNEYDNGSLATYFQIPDYFAGPTYEVTAAAVRFSTEPNERCTVLTGSVLIYGDANVGDPGLRVYLYDDDGFGFPGAKLDSVDFPQGTLAPTGIYWADADFSAGGWVFEDGADYHIGFAPITDSPDDTLGFLADDGTGHAPATPFRNTWYRDGGGFDAWYPVASTFVSGTDFGLFVAAETCCAEIPYSECYSQDYYASINYYWGAPHATYGDSAYAMRFSVGGPETLTSVDFTVFNATGYNPANVGASYVFGNDDIHVTVYDDDGFGLPGTQIAQVIIPATTYPAFPSFTTAVFAPLVLTSTFHVALSSSAVFGSGDCEAFLSDNGASASGRGSSAWDPGAPDWVDMLSGWGVDAAFVVTANLCKDEFNTCSYIDSYDNTTQTYPVPDANPITAWGQKFTASGDNCEIRDVAVDFWWRYEFDAGRAATMYTRNTEISIYTNASGEPGTLLGTVTLTPADYAAAGNVGFNPLASYAFTVHANFDPLDIQLVGDYWVVVNPLAPVRDSGIRLGIDADGGPIGPDCLSAYAIAFGGWLGIPFGSFDSFSGMVATTYHCCIPYGGRACTGASDYPRYGGNDASDGATQVALGDAWCDLNYLWHYNEVNASSNTVHAAGPIIFDGKVVSNFFDRYRRFDLATGTLLNTWGPGAAGLTNALGSQLIGSGTAAVLPNSGDTILFLGGGANNNMVAVDWQTGTQTWGLAVGPNQGAVRGGAFMVLDQGGTDVLYYVTNSGNVVARNANTGALYGGWGTNPVALGGNSSEITGATDGTDLYFSTDPAAPANGSVFKVNAATGAIIWSVPAANLKAATLPAYSAAAVNRESFPGGVAVGGGNVYVNSLVPFGNGNFPADGIFYKLNAGTGAVDGFAQSEGLYLGSTSPPTRAHAVIDINRVIIPVASRWAGGSLFGASAIAFNKAFSTIDWAYVHPVQAAGLDAALTCEPEPDADLIVEVMSGGWVAVLNSITGDEIFRRRLDAFGVSGISTLGRGVAIGNGPYVALTNRAQNLVVLAPGVSRPRLEFLTYTPTAPVEFGSNPALPLNFGPLITNTGCEVLNIQSAVADENPFTPAIPNFRIVEDNTTPAMSRAGEIANLLTSSRFGVKGVQDAAGPDVASSLNLIVNSREMRNRAASAAPAWLVSITHPNAGDVLNPGDTMDFEVVVNQNLISRGPQTAFVQLGSDDPDFFLNDTAASPQFFMTVVGGCLTDTTDLEFGIGAANVQHVFNHGRLGDGNYFDASDFAGFDVDGEDAQYYQGSYIYGVSQRRIAWNSPEWYSNVTDEWIGLQADPNWCDSTCKPALTSPYAVGSISSDGLTYTPINANMVCRSYLDSVQNFDDGGGGWDVEQWSAAPFDNDSTMGLYVRSHVVGAVDEPSLANVTVDIMTVTERNGDSVAGWGMGSINDMDVGGGDDTASYNASISAAWGFNPSGAGGNVAQVKLPFGCGQTPLRNVRALDGRTALFGTANGANDYFDSAYFFMQAPPGGSGQSTIGVADGENHITYLLHDFGPNEELQFAVAFITLPNTTGSAVADPTLVAMARQTNKWTGWGRGDVNDDNVINLADIIYLAANVNFGGPGPIPFAHLGDVNNSGGAADQADVDYLINFYFNCGPCPVGAFVF